MIGKLQKLAECKSTVEQKIVSCGASVVANQPNRNITEKKADEVAVSFASGGYRAKDEP
jgi:hypothetical protein